MRRAAKNKAEMDWWHTSQIVAAIYNGPIHRKDKRVWSAADFHPLVKHRSRPELTAEQVRAYKPMCKTHTKVKASEVRLKK